MTWSSKSLFFLLALVGIPLLLAGCGNSAGSSTPNVEPSFTPTQGTFGFATQCPYGSVSPVDRIRGAIWGCPALRSPLVLDPPPPDLIFQADCRKRLLSIRNLDKTLDTLWEISADGRFNITLLIPRLDVRDPAASGGGFCQSPARVTLWGALECKDRDQVRIRFDSEWELNPVLGSGASASCPLFPTGCRIHVPHVLEQCPTP